VLLFRGLEIGDVPPTPPTPTAQVCKDQLSEFLLLAAARCLGQPVGYLPEHNGSIVQNIVPVAATQDRQISTSSRVTLQFHTETAFHPYRPRYLLLLCLRGDPLAHTTFASIFDIIAGLDAATIEILRQARFRTAVDESFRGGGRTALLAPVAVLSGPTSMPTFVYDADLMLGVDAEAQDALDRVGIEIAKVERRVTLSAGDLLVIDNNLAVHGRSPFVPRFDGTDRWLQRTFVVSDLAPSAADRCGRIIKTIF
jgi:alpha-ketoglutarate-dependent taurine dioxygenase